MVKVTRYNCPICKKSHTIEFEDGFHENRSKYPFPYVYIHNFEGERDDIAKQGEQILTTLYIDANAAVRGVEGYFMEGKDSIISKDETNNIVIKLMENINKLQEDYDLLLKENIKLKEQLK